VDIGQALSYPNHCGKGTVESDPKKLNRFSADFFVSSMSVLNDIQESAQLALHYYYCRVSETLLDDPESRSWYIDDRAEPNMFWRLLSVAYPELYLKRTGKKKIPKTYLPDVVRFLTKDDVKEVVEHLSDFIRPCYDCKKREVLTKYRVRNPDLEYDLVDVCRECYKKQE